MRYLNSKIATVGIFFSATTLLIIYLLSIRWHIYLPVALFWVAISLMLGTIVYQVLQGRLSPGYAKVVLLEIAVTCLVFHLIYQIPYYGLRGSDSYIDLASAKGILSSGFIRGDPEYLNGTSYFPIIHILGAQLALITNVGLFSVAKWCPSLLDVALIPLLYLLIRSIFKEEKIALLSALLFACLQQHILFSSLFIRETIALILAVCCVYLYFSARSSAHPATYRALSIMCLVGTVIAHHLTSFMLVIFLLIHFLVTKVSELSFLRRSYFRDNIAGEKITNHFILLAFVVLFAYWIGVSRGPLYTLVNFTKEILDFSQWGMSTYGEIASISATSIQTIRGYIMFYGFYSFLFIFGAILLYQLFYQLLSRVRNYRLEVFSFTLFLFLSGIGALIVLYVIPSGIAPYPDRFLMYGWLFGFAPLVLAILKGRYKSLRRIGIFLLVVFMLSNIYLIEPMAWDAKAEGVPAAPSKEDYALANTFDFSTGKMLLNSYTQYAIDDVHNILGSDVFSDVNLSECEWVIIQKEALRLEQKYHLEPRNEAIAEMEQLEKEGCANRNKIYESNSLSVFKLR